MFHRRALDDVLRALGRQSAVGLLGPRQVGKTTLALEVAGTRPAIYLDLESPRDRLKLNDPLLFLTEKADSLIILDEIHRMPQLFEVLRGVIDEGRRMGNRKGRFLVLGSAAIDLLRQSGETLAGRIEYVELNPFDILEVGAASATQNALWLRGGFPDSFLAASDDDSFSLRQNFIRTYLERDIPQFSPRAPAEMLGRLWTMLAHSQGTILNISRLATNLSVSSHAVSNYIDLLTDLLIVRRLPSYQPNVSKRLTKSPKYYLRDSGILHALLKIRTRDDLLSHPVLGESWEGFVTETLLSIAPPWAKASVYHRPSGAEIDLVLELGPRHGIWAIEIKHGLSPTLARGFHTARDDIQPTKSFLVYSGQDRFPYASGIDVIGLHQLATELSAIS